MLLCFCKIGPSNCSSSGYCIKESFFRSFPNLLEYYDLFFNVYNRLVTKKHCPGTLSCSFKTRKSMQISPSASKNEHFFKKCTYWWILRTFMKLLQITWNTMLIIFVVFKIYFFKFKSYFFRKNNRIWSLQLHLSSNQVIQQNNLNKVIQCHGTFHGLKITNSDTEKTNARKY